MIRVLYFARLREQLGLSREDIPFKTGDTVDALRARLSQRHACGNCLLQRDVRCAVNHELAPLQRPLMDNDEVAFFPPVTGG